MIIPHPVVKLDYDPITDILTVDWPDFTDLAISEAQYILDTFIETVIAYDVSYLLTDTRNGTVNIAEAKYKELAYNFATKLAKTRIMKIARVVSEATVRETPVKEVTQQAQLTIPLKNFTTKKEALVWLIQK